MNISKSSRFLLLLGWLGGAADAQTQPEAPHIRVTGRSTVSVEPDHAQVDVGVVTEASEAAAAARGNADKLEAVLRALRDTLGPEARLDTLSYSLQPNYRRPSPGEEPVLSGYTATNVVRIRDLALDVVGKVVDVATGAGANSVRNIVFGLRDEDQAKERALREAAADARRKSQSLADELGVRIEGILSVSEGEADLYQPVRQTFMAEMARGGAATPIEAGTIEIRASLTLVVAIAQ